MEFFLLLRIFPFGIVGLVRRAAHGLQSSHSAASTFLISAGRIFDCGSDSVERRDTLAAGRLQPVAKADRIVGDVFNAVKYAADFKIETEPLRVLWRLFGLGRSRTLRTACHQTGCRRNRSMASSGGVMGDTLDQAAGPAFVVRTLAVASEVSAARTALTPFSRPVTAYHRHEPMPPRHGDSANDWKR